MRDPARRAAVTAACCLLTVLPAAGAESTTQPVGASPEPTTRPTTAPATAQTVKYFAPPPDGWPRDVPTGFRKRVPLRGMQAGRIAKRAWYHLAVPKDYTPDRAYPLVIVLHGGPTGGADQVLPFYRGGLLAQDVIAAYPMALVPQLLDWNYPHAGAYLVRIVQQIAREYRLDPHRLYVTGVSMGGAGAWVQGALGREVWAAIGPVSGWYGASESPDVKLLADMPVYCLHGQNDRAVPASRSRTAFAALKRIGREVKVFNDRPDAKDLTGADCIYREIAGAGHNCFVPWKKRGAPELGRQIAWMLAQRRDRPADLDHAMRRIADHGRRFGWVPEGSPVGRYRSAASAPASQRKTARTGD